MLFELLVGVMPVTSRMTDILVSFSTGWKQGSVQQTRNLVGYEFVLKGQGGLRGYLIFRVSARKCSRTHDENTDKQRTHT